MERVANTGNFLVDYGLDTKIYNKEKNFVNASFNKKDSNYTNPNQPVQQQTPEWQKLGLQSAQELQIMKGMKADGFTAEEFTEAITQYRQRQQGEAILQEEIVNKEPIGKGFKEGTEDIIGGAISNVPSIIGNTFGFLADVVTPKKFEGLGDTFRENGIRDKKAMQKLLGVNPDSFATDVGEFGSEIGVMFIPGGQSKLISKFPQAAEKIRKIGKVVDNIGEKAPKIYRALKTTLGSAAVGAAGVGKFEVISEGEVTPEGLAIGAIANPVLTAIPKGVKGLINKFGGARTTEEVAGNILQPTGKAGSLSFDSAKEGLKKAITKLGKKEIKDIDDYVSLKSIIEKEKSKTFKPLMSRLDKITATYKDDSVTDALTGLSEIISKQPGKKFKKLASEINELMKKNTKSGLTLSEIQKVKTLHTQNNRLFTETGKETTGVTSEALREVRKDIKLLIEQKAKENGFRGVSKINTEYSNLLDAESLINTQIGRLTNYLGREGKQTFLQNVAEFLTELPGVKQAITQPAQTLVGTVFRTLRAGKVNPLEVEKQLPALLRELRSSGVPEKAISDVMTNILSTLRLMSAVGINETLKTITD